MPVIDTLTYHGTHYTWHHEPQNLYEARHITIQDAVVVIESGIVEVQQVNGEERHKPEPSRKRLTLLPMAGNPYWESKEGRKGKGGQYNADDSKCCWTGCSDKVGTE